MNVLMFGWELPPDNSGGLGVACYGLAKGLSGLGVNISFALPRRLRANVSFMRVLSHKLQGMQVTAINSLLEAYMSPQEYTSYRSSVTNERLAIYGRSMLEEATRFGEMAAAWSRTQPHNVIHAHDWMTYQAAMKAQRVSGRPWVAHIHATEYDRTGGRVNNQIAEIEYQGLNKADRVIAVSGYTKDIVNRYYGVPLDRIEVVHNGIDLVEFEPADLRKVFPNDNVVLFVGRLTFQKGVDYFLEAAQVLLKTHKNTIFLVVGHGDKYEELVMKSACLGISNRVVFPGFLSGRQLRACYQMADVFVMPSVSEPYGIVALEALASNTPAIISRQSGVAETLTNVYKVDFWDVSRMAKLMATVLDYPRLSSELAGMAKKEAAKMTWEIAAQKTRAVYSQLI